MTTQELYEAYAANPSPESLAEVINSLKPTLVSEASRYPGPRGAVLSHAKLLAVKAVKTYNPASGAKLNTWVTGNLRGLSRFGQELARPAHVPEIAARQAAHLDALRGEMADELGRDPSDEELADRAHISVKRVTAVKSMARPFMREGQMTSFEGDDQSSYPAVDNQGPDPALHSAVEAVLQSSDDRDQMILKHKIGHGGAPQLSNQEIAKRLGVSPAFVSQRGAALAGQVEGMRDAF